MDKTAIISALNVDGLHMIYISGDHRSVEITEKNRIRGLNGLIKSIHIMTAEEDLTIGVEHIISVE
jgi:hypothetical protein